MLSKSAEYALRAVHRLAFAPHAGPVPASELAERMGVPANYLSKLLDTLRKEGVVEATRGRGGGFSLARDPSEISLAEIIAPFDEDILRRHCLLGRPECRDDAPCVAHHRWLEVAGALRRFFRETSVEDLGPPVRRGDPPGSDGSREAAGIAPDAGASRVRASGLKPPGGTHDQGPAEA
jgi:Rrf2 family protein